MYTHGHFDVVIVGAGLSGIDAAYHLQTSCPQKTYAILEGREAIGGTWDLFRYPGVRSDSDLHTLGFPFHPWHSEESIAGGEAIRNYIRETAQKFGIDRHIRLGHQLLRANWSSTAAHWMLEARTGSQGEVTRLTCAFLYMCSGYYDYRSGFRPQFPGIERFKGQFLHPQSWPADVDYAGKRIIVIGSGATAVTLVPALASKASHVTMLQRSPSYVVSRAAKDAKAIWMYKRLPKAFAAKLIKWKNVAYGIVMFHLARTRPNAIKRVLISGVRKALAPGYDIERHFTPSYNPWDQRVCLVPDGDLFAAIRGGNVAVVTDTIECFVESGIQLRSGAILEADMVVSATGLIMTVMGGTELSIDGAALAVNTTTLYKGAMLSGVPNLALAIGYSNASWTLRCDLTARYVCRLLNYMGRHGWAVAVPSLPDTPIASQPLMDFSSGYVRRGIAVMPSQGPRAPWRTKQNYLKDSLSVMLGSINDGILKFRARHDLVTLR